MSDDEVTLAAIAESLRENLRLEEIRRKATELENRALNEQLRAARERLREFEDKPTEPPPASERPTSRSGMMLEIMSNLEQIHAALGPIVSNVELACRMSIQATKAITEDLPVLVEDAVKRAASDLKLEFGSELQKAKTKAYEAAETAKLVQEKCASCPHWREAS